MVIWITGLSGSGKSSIALELYRSLKPSMPNLVLLDGDHVRDIMGNDLGFTAEDRHVGATRISRLCHWLHSQGIAVICATIGFFEDVRGWNRENIARYFEVYVRVSLDSLLARDPNGLYEKALAGDIKNVVGVDLKLAPPQNADLVIDNDVERSSLSGVAEQILQVLPWSTEPVSVSTGPTVDPTSLTKSSP